MSSPRLPPCFIRGFANHPFLDGNKRTAVIALVMFLEMNGCATTMEQGEMVGFTVDTAEGQVDEGGEGQEEARRRFDEGDDAGARELLKSAAGDLRRLAPDSPQGDALLRQAEVIDRSVMALQEQAFDAGDMKRLKYNARMQSRRRR